MELKADDMENENKTTPVGTVRRARKAKNGSIPRAELDALADGIPTWNKTAFHMVGPRDGVRIAVPNTQGILRAYLYAGGDYAIIPEHPAIRVFQPDERKERKLGGVQAELDFSLGLDNAREALGLLVEAVRREDLRSASQTSDVGSEPSEPDATEKV